MLFQIRNHELNSNSKIDVFNFDIVSDLDILYIACYSYKFYMQPDNEKALSHEDEKGLSTYCYTQAPLSSLPQIRQDLAPDAR